MSQIGRVFSVLNVALAAIFLWSAGTFLQQHTDYKKTLADERDQWSETQTDLEGQIASAQQELNDTKRQLTQANTNLSRSNTEIDDLKSTNQSLRDRLSAFEADMKSLNAALAGMKSSIETATSETTKMSELAIEARATADKAQTEAREATAAKRDAEVRIAELSNQLENLQMAKNDVEEERKRLELLVAAAKVKAPGIFANLAPSFSGTVTNVGPEGKLFTLKIAEPASVDNGKMYVGTSVAVFDASEYKGELIVTDVFENGNAFAQLRAKKNGSGAMKIGDSFDSQVN